MIRISDNSEPDSTLSYSDKEDGSRIQVDHLARIYSPLDDEVSITFSYLLLSQRMSNLFFSFAI